MFKGALIGLGVVGIGAAVTLSIGAGAQNAARISSTRVIDNDRVTVLRLTFPPGAREQVHVTPQDLVVMQATPGDVEVTVDKETSTGRVETGKSWYVSKVTPHAYSNVGKDPFDLVVVFLK